MNFQYWAKTDTGRARKNNEDALVFDESTGVVVLADGMGGYNAGEVASGMATAFIQSELSRWLTDAGPVARAKDIRRAMEICVEKANMSILNAANSNAQYSGMGTTLVVGVFRQEGLVLGHIGDSRCYRMRAGQLEQITRDHSLLQEQIDSGLVTPEQAQNSTIKNLVTRALGVEESVALDVSEHAVLAGDLYILCSDGLSDMVNDEGIAKIVGLQAGLEQTSQTLVQAANESGGRDNISVLLVEVSEATEKRGLIARLLGK